MTDPKRWSDAGDAATPLEQLLVRKGQALPMPVSQKSAIWTQIVGAIASPSLEPNPLHGVDTASKGSLLTTPAAIKMLGLVTALASLGVVGRYVAVSSITVAPTASTAAPATVAPVAQPSPGAIQSTVLSSPEPGSDTVPNGLAPEPNLPTPSTGANRTTVPSRASQLRQESQAVLAARQALRSNDASSALRLLVHARQRFGNGVLNEEREALTIEALARSGDKARAAQRAKTFLRAHPRSPHAADVQRYVAE